MEILKRIQAGWRAAVRKGAFANAFLKGLDISRDEVSNPYEEHTWTYAV